MLHDKAGSATNDAPAVKTACTATGSAGSHSAAVSKFEALFNVLGHSIARFPCGRTVQVTPGALVDISFHGSLSA